ncbi:MAG TPA: DNA polymerase III subunit psi [Burkholderiales bacterium]|nr:DNA polymerase III subunit psi [Burkholderiales bacterium]
MRNNAVLAELELMPLWQLRTARCNPDRRISGPLTAMPVSTRQGAEGWALVSRPLDEEEKALFMNLLFAMKLRCGEDISVDHAKLQAEAAAGRISWLWLIGKDAVSMLGMTSPAESPMWQELTVFISAHPAEMLSHPELKREFWGNWCRYCA